jgi:hypothetical protein
MLNFSLSQHHLIEICQTALFWNSMKTIANILHGVGQFSQRPQPAWEIVATWSQPNSYADLKPSTDICIPQCLVGWLMLISCESCYKGMAHKPTSVLGFYRI